MVRSDGSPHSMLTLKRVVRTWRYLERKDNPHFAKEISTTMLSVKLLIARLTSDNKVDC